MQIASWINQSMENTISQLSLLDVSASLKRIIPTQRWNPPPPANTERRYGQQPATFSASALAIIWGISVYAYGRAPIWIHHSSSFITIWGTPHNELGLYLSVVDTEPSRVKYDDLLYIRKGIMESHNQTPNGLTKKTFSTCTLKIFEGPQSSRPKNDWVCLRIGHPQIP